ncbi:MAG: hypothetical protein FJ279_25575 [Planctomycetes bacterium]|nr:hypothetical protein [Planctomycetota bacterium]
MNMDCICCIVIVVVACGAAFGAEMRLSGEFKDEALKRDVLAVCRDALGVYEKRIAAPPPLGPKPFVVRQASDGKPRADLRGLPNEYWVNITCLFTRQYCQIVYQVAHELGHHYIHPQRNNWLIESTATALSLRCLSEMGEKWKTNPPFGNWKPYAPHFPEYRENTIKGQLGEIGLKPDSDLKAWVRSELPTLVRERKVRRPEQHACAILIEDAFRRHPDAWGAVCQLGAATSADGYTDFAAWEKLVGPKERALVKDLAALFGPVFEAGKTAP